MSFAPRQAMGAVVCALGLIALSGCATMRHHRANKPQHCPEPALTGDVQNMPPLRAPSGLDAPDTRNAIKIPPLPEPLVVRSPSAPCLSAPPSFGEQLAPYAGPSSSRSAGAFNWQVNAGAAFPMGKSSNYLNTGWTVGGALLYRHKPQSPFALQLDLGYSDFNASRKLVDLGQQNVQSSIDGGHADVWLLTAAGKYTVPFGRNANAYGLLGIGAYHESLHVTEQGTLGAFVCDPWGYCNVAATNGAIAVAGRSLTKFGWNVGLGVEFALRARSAWYVETRYHSVQGSRSIQYLPLQIGYRF